METALGLIRDAVAAALALAILFNVPISDDQVAGILLFVTTVLALGVYAYNRYRASRPPSGGVGRGVG
jgi:hypothetical protein